ncbi:ML domain-containing protein [Mycotypha africana]|uniref:ML domain-containing protein n=1 Tax=Mycotypha africana TaxID=64632 RepID=UPI00230103D4|nr:ML domain-containing protein [Mycotypha africana]KAI8984331.1 ML domain-containing protein [Mycotypha africana]
MKQLSALVILLFTAIALTYASVIPGFLLQDEDSYDIVTDQSTKLITNCGNASDLLKIDYINLNPDPPLRGTDLEIEFKGFLKETVPEGTKVQIMVKFGVVRLLQKEFDFCDKIQEIGEKCPIPKGELKFKKVVSLPREIPPGKYTVHAEIFTPAKKRVTCLLGQTVFPRSPLY